MTRCYGDPLDRAAEIVRDQRRLIDALRAERDELRDHQRHLEVKIANQRLALADLQYAHDAQKIRANTYREFVDEATMDEFLKIYSRIQRKNAAITEEQERERARKVEWESIFPDDGEDDCCDCCDCTADIEAREPTDPFERLLRDMFGPN